LLKIKINHGVVLLWENKDSIPKERLSFEKDSFSWN
jgi:hypothetical protein